MSARPAFRQQAPLADLSKGLVLKPMLQKYLFDAEFPSISLEIGPDEHSLAHGPDGWFHPSTHPAWEARQLYWYMAAPDKMLRESKEYMGTLSITFGKLTHKFVQLCLADMGVLVSPTKEQILNGEEPDARDPVARSKGHYDGELEVHIPSHPDQTRCLFEFKTRSPRSNVIADLDLPAFTAKYPEYYLQVQDYMRMTGLRVAIVLMMSMGFPWEMTEVHIPYDREVALSIERKYLTVLECVVAETMPSPCCAPGSKESRGCPARLVCPNGSTS